MADAPKIRFVSYEIDEDTTARSVCDIREFDAPRLIQGSTSFTAISKDETRRALMTAFAHEVDRLLSGQTDEINVFLAR